MCFKIGVMFTSLRYELHFAELKIIWLFSFKLFRLSVNFLESPLFLSQKCYEKPFPKRISVLLI